MSVDANTSEHASESESENDSASASDGIEGGGELVQVTLNGDAVSGAAHREWVMDQLLTRFPVLETARGHARIPKLPGVFERLQRVPRHRFTETVFRVRRDEVPECVHEHVIEHAIDSVEDSSGSRAGSGEVVSGYGDRVHGFGDEYEYELVFVAVHPGRVRVVVSSRKKPEYCCAGVNGSEGESSCGCGDEEGSVDEECEWGVLFDTVPEPPSIAASASGTGSSGCGGVAKLDAFESRE